MTGLGSYVVRIVGPAGHERYLTARFIEGDFDDAHRFSSAKAAHAFGEMYFATPRGLCFWDVQSTDDPESGSVDCESADDNASGGSMNATRHDKAIERLVANEYAMAGFLGSMLKYDDVPELHREAARRLLAEHQASVTERETALKERSP